MSAPTFADLILEATCLEDLIVARDADPTGAEDDPADLADLPVFSGEATVEEPGEIVWSWDDTRVLMGRCASEWEIFPRSAPKGGVR